MDWKIIFQEWGHICDFYDFFGGSTVVRVAWNLILTHVTRDTDHLKWLRIRDPRRRHSRIILIFGGECNYSLLLLGRVRFLGSLMRGWRSFWYRRIPMGTLIGRFLEVQEQARDFLTILSGVISFDQLHDWHLVQCWIWINKNCWCILVESVRWGGQRCQSRFVSILMTTNEKSGIVSNKTEQGKRISGWLHLPAPYGHGTNAPWITHP